MRKVTKKWIAGMLSLAMVLTAGVVPEQTAGAAAKKMKLSATKVTVKVKQSKKVTVKNAPKKAKISWSSKNKKIAKVSNKGKITGVKKGNTKVVAKVVYKKGKKKVTKKLTVKVTDPLSQSATSEVVQLLIPAKEKTPTVSAVLYDTSGTTRPHDGNEFEEGQVAYVRFTLEPEASERALHAYLVPRNEASSNLVEIAKAVRDNGILIQANKTNSNASAALTLLDGTALTDGSSGQIEFDIVLKDDEGNVDTTYVPASPALEQTVKNVPAQPEENGLYINGAAEAIPSHGRPQSMAVTIPPLGAVIWRRTEQSGETT